MIASSMPRRKLSEFRAKSILYPGLQRTYTGVEIATAGAWEQAFDALPAENYTVKVDQAIKGRFKKGLVKLSRTKAEAHKDVVGFAKAGYAYVLVEPYYAHQQQDERYLALRLERDGVTILYSAKGGVDIEVHVE
jgi:succinyl-CoA synthetase beta subunit